MRFLVIASDVPEVLNLPWEFLLPPDCDFLGIDPRFGIRRHPGSGKLVPFNGDLRPRPLRLLFVACSPTDLPTLDYEREEEALFRAISGQNVAFDSCDMGTFEELKEKVSEFKPHIVHMTGHGAVIDGQGRFAFEDESGKKDLVPSEDLRRFLAGSGVQCVFVSGCQTGKAPVEAIGGICQGLVSAEVPLAVGWAASIADDLATNFAKTFYKSLKDAQPVDRALLLARLEAWKVCKERDDPSWTLPVLYAATNQRMIFDRDTQRMVEEPPRPMVVQEALPGMKEGYADHFVGRRREQQRLLPALRSGDLQILIITGLGGSGKSSLATRLARKLETYGFIPIPVSSSEENPLNSARLLQAFGDAFREAARKHRSEGATIRANKLDELVHELKRPDLSVEDRLHDAVGALNRGQFLLLLDNFESNLDESDRRILDAEISKFYKYLIGHLTGGSRAIITTRYPLSDVPALPPKVHREDLDDFAESSFLKILQCDPEVEQRIRSSELPLDLLRDLYRKFGGTPRFLLQIREAIKKMDAQKLAEELSKVEFPADAKDGELQKLRDKYFGDIFTERLFGLLSSESQNALSRLAVYNIPVLLEGIGAVSNEPLETMLIYIIEWEDRAFAYPKSRDKKLWIVYGLLRGWLIDRLNLEERKLAHKAAGVYLYEQLQQRKEGSLSLSWMDCLEEARIHFIHADDFEQARTTTNILSSFYINRGLYEDVKRVNKPLLEHEAHWRPMIWCGMAYLNQGRCSKATECFNRALSLAEPISTERAAALHGLAIVDREKGDYGSARKRLQEVINIGRNIGNLVCEVAALQELAMIDYELNEIDESRKKFEKAMEIENVVIKKAVSASTLNNLGSIYSKQGKHDKALEMLIEALKTEQQNGDRRGEGMTFSSLGMEALWSKRLEDGLRLFVLSATILGEIEHVDVREAKPIVDDLAQRLNYSPEQLELILHNVAESYKEDKGWRLIEAAFGKGRSGQTVSGC